MYDGQQRLMNGGNVVPPMMHMQNSLPPQPPHNHPSGGMYPFGLEQHMEPPQQHIPKLDQQWDAHLLMDDKHLVSYSRNTIFVRMT